MTDRLKQLIALADGYDNGPHATGEYRETANPQTVKAMAELLEGALLSLENFVGETVVPDPNCSCHISPPCGDCVENSFLREVIDTANKQIAAIQAFKENL
jgi:hypothetical protein